MIFLVYTRDVCNAVDNLRFGLDGKCITPESRVGIPARAIIVNFLQTRCSTLRQLQFAKAMKSNELSSPPRALHRTNCPTNYRRASARLPNCRGQAAHPKRKMDSRSRLHFSLCRNQSHSESASHSGPQPNRVCQRVLDNCRMKSQ